MEKDLFFSKLRLKFPFFLNEKIELYILDKKECYEIYEQTWNEDRSVITCLPLEKLAKDKFQNVVKEMQKENLFLPIGLLRSHDNAALLIGRIEISHYNSRNKSVEIGYYLLPEFRGQRIMSHSLKIIVNVLFEVGINKIYAQTASFNVPSFKMLEGIGFERDGVLREHHEYRNELYDDYLYSMTRRDWKYLNYNSEMLYTD